MKFIRKRQSKLKDPLILTENINFKQKKLSLRIKFSLYIDL